MKIKIFFFLLLFVSQAHSQEKEFEGIVKYKVEVKNPNPKVISDSLWNAKLDRKKSIHKYYYKNNNYKNVIDNKSIQLYKPKSNEIYNYIIENDTVFNNKLKADTSIDPLKDIEKSVDTEYILGYECKKLVLKSKFAETTYYYSKRLKIPAKNFINHHYGNWYEYLKETNALPLKIIIRNKFLFLEMTAINVEIKKLDISEFKFIKPGNVPK